MKTLDALARYLSVKTIVSGMDVLEIYDLFVDSRDVVPGSAFIAIQGAKNHGMDFAQKAIDQGAACILTDQPGSYGELGVPVLVLSSLSEKLADLADWFYSSPSRDVPVIGITGTNGKTSTSHYIAQMLHFSGYQVALLGTLGNGLLGQLHPSANTTLEVVSLNRMLRRYVESGADYVVMEVSSHAIILERIAKVTFEVLALTQVTRDHLDFHGTEAAYRQSKAKLFLDYPARWQVLNLQDSLGVELAEQFTNSPRGKMLGYAVNSSKVSRPVDLTFESIEFLAMGLSGTIRWHDQLWKVRSKLMGAFNAENLLCSIGVCLACGLSFESLSNAIIQLQPVSGRMERVAQSPVILIDYAHTPDALQAVLNAVKQHLHPEKSRLWVVFGCGGDRDAGKRPLMGDLASRCADKVILTDDNPRFESPEKIVTQILSGIGQRRLGGVKVIHDRAQAIEYAVLSAKKEDILVVAGKGHEDTQEINGQKYPMSDAGLVNQAMQKRVAEDNSREGA